jgi:hypothetical protein
VNAMEEKRHVRSSRWGLPVEGMSCVAESVQSFAMTCFSSTSTHPLILYRTIMFIIAHMVFRYKSDEEVLELFHTYPCEPCRGGADGRLSLASQPCSAAFKVINIDMPCLLPSACL